LVLRKFKHTTKYSTFEMDLVCLIIYSIIRDRFKCPVSHMYVDSIAPFIGKLTL